MTVATLCAALGVIAMSAGCGGVSPSVEDRLPALTNDQGIAVSAEDSTAPWPFTVDRIILKCGDKALNHVVLEADGRTYALNGSARGSKRWPDFELIWKSSGSDSLGLIRVPLPPDLIQRGLALCE